MGADSVKYHQDNVLGRADDHPGQALDYYGSRGETPLRWGGAGTERLGLTGEVTPAAYEAILGPGGATDPLLGRRLVNVKRPGFEVVVDTHKTVAVLGVIGRADDMHAILDAETAGTMGFLDPWVQERGGRRGRDQRRTPTGGLTYAVTRHATSRAGDPQPHDHILVANLVEMRDTTGGWKALDSAALRDLASAAERIGHLHGAAQAVRLGYGIERVDEDSGNRVWKIAGIPDEVWGLYSKRHDEIAAYMATRAYDTPQARRVAAVATRAVKRFTGAEDLMPRWQAELEEIGWSVERLAAALDNAREDAPGLAPPLTDTEIDSLVADLFGPRGAFLRRSKVFTRSRLIEEVAPALYGHDPAELDPVLDRILASREVVPLVGVEGAREQTYATATVLATESRIANSVERLATQPYPTLTHRQAGRAIAAKQAETGHPFTAGQHRAAHAVARSGRRVDVVVGVAGSGKTTMLDAVTAALEDAGHAVIGTSTSGQAARTLRDEARIEANTVARLLGRLDYGHLTLDERTIVVLDEAAMTADADLLRLVLAVEHAGAKLVLVGDHHQLAAIGPGGALQAVIERHPEIAVEMAENVRQHDSAERAALAQLRHGSVPTAVDWYARNNRTLVAPTRLDALANMVDAWAADTAAGHDTIMLAYRRRDVADLNRLARHHRRQTGQLAGPDLEAPGGRRYAVGDRVVLTAPNNPKGLVTSERATVTGIDPHRAALTLTTDAGHTVTLTGTEFDDQRLDHGYALTVHRTQAATVDRAHLFADGGGRQLGYVAMSRARQRATVHAVADNLDQALEDIETDWTNDRRQRWLTDTTSPGTDPRPLPVDPAAQAARLQAELAELERAAPPRRTAALVAARTDLARLETDRRDLEAGRGRFADTPAGRAARHYDDVHRQRLAAQHQATAPGVGWRDRRRWAKVADRLGNEEALARDDWYRLVEPTAGRIDRKITRAKAEVTRLEGEQRFHRDWVAEHPDHARRLASARRELLRHEEPERARLLDQLDQARRQAPTPDRGHGIGL